MKYVESKAKITFNINKTDIKNNDEYLNLVNKSDFSEVKSLTLREKEILKFITEGKTNAQIGKILKISQHTVKTHIKKIFEKLCANDRVQAAVKAIKYGIIE